MTSGYQYDDLSPWKTYLFRIFIGIDQLLNILLLGFPDESISGRIGRAMLSGSPKWFVRPLQKYVDKLFLKLFDEVDHCENAIEPEEKFEQRRELWTWSK